MRSNAPWSKQDLFFLRSSLHRGSSFAEIARFLGRYEDEVREKAEELEIARGRDSSPSSDKPT
jgi:hypothetical protein